MIPIPVRCAAFGAASLALAAPTLAQSEPVNGMRPADVRRDAIVDATIIPEPGRVIENGTVVMRDGVIEAVGADLPLSPSTRVWPGEGLTVYAGLIDAAVLVETEPEPPAPGRHWNALIHPEVRMAERDPLDAKLRKSLRDLGFTTVATYPAAGIVRGTGAVVALDEDPRHVRVYADAGPMALGFDRAGSWAKPATPGSLMGAIALLRQVLLDADWHGRARAVYAEHPEGNEPPPPAEALVAIAPVVEGRQRVLFETKDEHDLLRAARIAREFGLDAIMLGSGTEFRRLDEVAALGLPLIVPVNFPEPPDLTDLHAAERVTLREMMVWEQAPTNPRRLAAAGVPMALSTHGLESRATFPKAVRRSIEHGLSPDAALAALTAAPARMLGLDGVMGTIAPGKIANLTVVKGRLFEEKAEVRDVWINGRRHVVNPEPEDPLVLAGTLRVEDRPAIPVRIDTESSTFRLEPANAKPIKARKVVRLRESLSVVIDAAPFGGTGYARLSAVIEDGALRGEGDLPGGGRSPFAGTADGAPDGGAAPGGGDGGGAVSGTWTLSLTDPDSGAEHAFELELTTGDAGGVGGTGTAGGEPVEITSASYDAATRELHLELTAPDGEAVVVEGTITGAGLEGTAERAGVTLLARGERAGGAAAAAELVMPPEELATPLGAFGVAAPPPAQRVLVTNATIWTCGPAGIIEGGSMLVEDGRIVAVGRDVRAPGGDDLVRIDGTGRHVTPGLIDCHSHTGISGGVNEFPQANTAEVRIGDVIDPDDVNWYRQLAGGLTAANLLHGSANPIGGQNCVVKLKWGGSAEDFPIPGAMPGIKFALGENVKRTPGRYPDTRMGVETFIRDAFTAARHYRDEQARYHDLPTEERQRTVPPRRDLELDALVEILEGRRLVHCHSYRQDEILMLIRVADDFGFTIGTFQHVLEGYKVADAIAAHGAGASSFSDWWAYKVEVMDAIPYNGALMNEMGVLVSFNSDSSELARRLNTEASKAVRYGGVTPRDALCFVTINPARQLRIGDRTGSLEVGKDADFVVWNRDPLSTYAVCEQTWIEGRRYFDRDEDLLRRADVVRERERLTQKILAKAHGAPPSASDEGGERPAAGPAVDAATCAWLEEQVRLGRDPYAVRPGECGCGGHASWANFKEH